MVVAQKAWNDETKYRVSQTASLLQYVKGIKILALESTVISYLQGLRDKEIKQSKPYRVLMLAFNVIGKHMNAVIVLLLKFIP